MKIEGWKEGSRGGEGRITETHAAMREEGRERNAEGPHRRESSNPAHRRGSANKKIPKTIRWVERGWRRPPGTTTAAKGFAPTKRQRKQKREVNVGEEEERRGKKREERRGRGRPEGGGRDAAPPAAAIVFLINCGIPILILSIKIICSWRDCSAPLAVPQASPH